MTIRRTTSALILALGLMGASARAATVTLKDGSILRGKVVEQTADGLQLVTPDGTLSVGLERIQKVEYGEEDKPRTSPSPAPAPRENLRNLLSLGIGFSQPISRVNFSAIHGGDAQNGDLSINLGAQYFHFLTPSLAAGVEGVYLDRSGTVSPRLFPAATSSVSGESWLMLALVRFSLPKLGKARPFLLAGAGGGWNTLAVDVRANQWADTMTHETRRLIDDSKWVPAFSARVGMDFDVNEVRPGVFTIEAGWTGMPAVHYASTPQGQALGLSGVAEPLSLLVFSARYGWRF